MFILQKKRKLVQEMESVRSEIDFLFEKLGFKWLQKPFPTSVILQVFFNMPSGKYFTRFRS